MFKSSRRQKGRQLEKFVARSLEKIFSFAYSRADSGAGKFNKEDITLPSFIPLHLECKNHNVFSLSEWWKQTVNGCPTNKMPVLIYKLPFFEPKVYMLLDDLIYYLSGVNGNRTDFNTFITMNFEDFEKILSVTKNLYGGELK